MLTAEFFVTLLGVYFGAGFVFAIAFVTVGLAQVDPNAANAKPSVRVLLVPGAMALWPYLVLHWLKGGIRGETPSNAPSGTGGTAP